MRRPGAGRTGQLASWPAEPAEESFDSLVASFRERLDRHLERFLERKRRTVAGREENLALVEGVARLVSGGGKRMRPALVYHAYRSCGGRSREPVMSVAMATELLHTYLLIHDDIMDRSDLRRGQPTAHVLFSELHGSKDWPGDPGHFGRSVAILLGDLAHSWAVELFYRAPLEDGRGDRLRTIFSSMCEEVIHGQYLESVLPYRREVSEEELLEVIRLKSGRYSVERPVELGALLAGAPPERLQVLRRYGRAVGQAFQLQDDILGTFGDSERAGKPGGTDLVEGKLTLLVHTALQASPPERAEELREVLLDPSPEAEAIERARSIIRESGALRRVRDIIEERLEEAREAVDPGFEDEDGRVFFAGLPDYLLGRER